MHLLPDDWKLKWIEIKAPMCLSAFIFSQVSNTCQEKVTETGHGVEGASLHLGIANNFLSSWYPLLSVHLLAFQSTPSPI